MEAIFQAHFFYLLLQFQATIQRGREKERENSQKTEVCNLRTEPFTAVSTGYSTRSTEALVMSAQIKESPLNVCSVLNTSAVR